MSTRTRRRLTEDERAQQRARERELTVRAVEQLRTSAGWQAWLRVRARTGLRRYSLGNQLLIAAPEAGFTLPPRAGRLRIRSSGRVISAPQRRFRAA